MTTRAHRRTLEAILAAARAELSTNQTITAYEMTRGRPVLVSAWCPVCRAPQACDVLTNAHRAVPDFLICTRCGGGVAIGDELIDLVEAA